MMKFPIQITPVHLYISIYIRPLFSVCHYKHYLCKFQLFLYFQMLVLYFHIEYLYLN